MKKKVKRRKLNKSERKALVLLIESLKGSFNFLSNSFKIKGYDSKDIKQMLYTKLVEEYPENTDKGKSWWFLRSKWFLFNLIKKSERDPLSRGVSIDAYTHDSEKTFEV